jgi:hypothetical protein
VTACKYGKRHRTTKTLMRCRLPRAAWIQGTGTFTLVSWCKGLTVSLHETLAAAEQSKTFIDRLACGGGCRRDHTIGHVDLDTQRWSGSGNR